MYRLLRIFIGPELYWVLLYFAFRWLAAHNAPPTEPGNAALEWAVWLTATAGVTLSFTLLIVPGVNRWVLFARLAIAAFIGLNACSIIACEAIKYPEPGRDSDLLGLWVMAVMLGGIVWCVSAGVSLIILRLKSSAVPRRFHHEQSAPRL
jgi:heme/copper-type cytochrome/quinol oxidase subunit 2